MANTFFIETSIGLIFKIDNKVTASYRFKTVDEAYELYKNQKISEKINSFISKSVIKEMSLKTDAPKAYLDNLGVKYEVNREYKYNISQNEMCEVFKIDTAAINDFIHDLSIKMTNLEKRPDIVELFNLVDSLEKDINTRTMRLKEWYALHFPELVTDDNRSYIEKIIQVGNRTTFCSEFKEDSSKEDLELYNLAKDSMGAPLGEEEIDSIVTDAKNVLKDMDNKKELFDILRGTIEMEYPNLYALMADSNNDITALCRLMVLSNNSLPVMTGAAIQVLGAKKDRSKYGIIFQTTFISKSKNGRGKISRILANKISLCAKIDFETNKGVENGEARGFYGEKFKKAILAKIEDFNEGITKKRVSMDEFNKKINKKKQLEFVKKR